MRFEGCVSDTISVDFICPVLSGMVTDEIEPTKVGSQRGPIYRMSQFLRREIKQYLLSMMVWSLGTGFACSLSGLARIGLHLEASSRCSISNRNE